MLKGKLSELSVAQLLCKYPVFGGMRHVLYPSSYYITVSCLAEQFDVLAVHQTAVGHNHEIVAYAIALPEVINHRYHSVALVLLAVEQAV